MILCSKHDAFGCINSVPNWQNKVIKIESRLVGEIDESSSHVQNDPKEQEDWEVQWTVAKEVR